METDQEINLNRIFYFAHENGGETREKEQFGENPVTKRQQQSVNEEIKI